MKKVLTLVTKKIEHLGLEVEKISVLNREDFEAENPKHNKLKYITYHIKTNNKNLFGEQGDVFTEVYPRLKQLKYDLLNGIEIDDNIRIEFVYRLSDESKEGKSYHKAEIKSFGDQVVDIDSLAAHNKYYDELRNKYLIYYGVKTNNGTVIGPDAGLIISANFVAEQMGEKEICMVEVGAGTCSTPVSILNKCNLKSYYGVDFSEKMYDHYCNKMKRLFDEKNIMSEFYICDGLSCRLPQKADIFSLGIYYEAQLDFIFHRHDEIKNMLGERGVLIIQTGLPENRMFNDMLVGESDSNWPWYHPSFCLQNSFQYVIQVNFNDEIVMIASNNEIIMKNMIEKISDDYYIEKIFVNEKVK